MAQIFGIWKGGASYSGADHNNVIEMFNSTVEAVAACQSRMDSGHWKPQTFDYLNRDSEDVLTPCVDETSEMDLYFADPTDEYDYEPDAVVRIDWDSEMFGLFTA